MLKQPSSVALLAPGCFVHFICPSSSSGVLNQEKSKAEKEYFEKVVEEGESSVDIQ